MNEFYYFEIINYFEQWEPENGGILVLLFRILILLFITELFLKMFPEIKTFVLLFMECSSYLRRSPKELRAHAALNYKTESLF